MEVFKKDTGERITVSPVFDYDGQVKYYYGLGGRIWKLGTVVELNNSSERRLEQIKAERKKRRNELAEKIMIASINKSGLEYLNYEKRAIIEKCFDWADCFMEESEREK